MTPSPPEPIPGARLMFALDHAVAYLNHGAFGAVPLPVQRAHQRLRDELESNPHRFFTVGLHERLAHARAHVAAFLGADPDGSAFVANATDGAGIVLRSLDLRPGDEILTTDHGYGAVTIAIDHACARTGAVRQVLPVDLDAGEEEIAAAFAARFATGRVRLAIIDQITSPTAKVMPVTTIAAVARAAGVPLLVDGAHAPGASATRVDAIGADFWVGNLHKWAYGPRPSALLSVAPQYRDRLVPTVLSWQADDGFPLALEMRGTIDYTPWLATPVGLHVMRTLGVEAIRAHNAALAAYGQYVIATALGVTPSNGLPDPGAPEASMRVVPLPPGVVNEHADALRLRERIADELHAEVAVMLWRGRAFVRICAQVYNRADEYERLATGLAAMLRA